MKSKKSFCTTPSVGVGGGIGVSKKFNVKVFYVMSKALTGELSCPCDRSCCDFLFAFLYDEAYRNRRCHREKIIFCSFRKQWSKFKEQICSLKRNSVKWEPYELSSVDGLNFFLP